MRIRALDSIRGLLLLQMTLDHFGKPISHYLYQCFGFFSAAEGFFFLSGFVGILAATSKGVKDPGQHWMRWRALKTWRYHIATLLVLCLLSYWLLPSIFGNFKSIFQNPVGGIFWSLLLVHTPEWLDVLPLYVVFLLLGSFVFPLFVKAKNKRQIFFLWLPSLAVWIVAQFGLQGWINGLFPAWVSHGDFDPYSWQFVYFSGAAVAAWWKRARAEESAGAPFAVRSIVKLSPLLIPILIFCFLWSHQFIPLELPSEIFTSKVHVGLLRFVNFFAFMLGICYIVRKWPNLLDFKFANVMGRHSLDVYSAHIVLVYLWFAVPNSIRYYVPWNVVVPVVACVLLWALAKLRDRK